MTDNEKIYTLVEDLFKKDKPTERERNAILVFNFEGQVNNGGFEQFFFNSTGESAQETLDALRAVGATRVAQMLERAINLWPDKVVPKTMLERRELLIKFNEDWSSTLYALDDEFYASNEVMAPYLGKYLSLV